MVFIKEQIETLTARNSALGKELQASSTQYRDCIASSQAAIEECRISSDRLAEEMAETLGTCQLYSSQIQTLTDQLSVANQELEAVSTKAARDFAEKDAEVVALKSRIAVRRLMFSINWLIDWAIFNWSIAC